jgi:hypothetical protein
MTYIDKLSDNKSLAYYFKKVFHLTPDDIKLKLTEQDFKCVVCDTYIADKFVVDHDHSCCPPAENAKGRTRKTCGNCVRGFLCGPCNRGIGLLKEDKDILMNAIKYLEYYETMNELIAISAKK